MHDPWTTTTGHRSSIAVLLHRGLRRGLYVGPAAPDDTGLRCIEIARARARWTGVPRAARRARSPSNKRDAAAARATYAVDPSYSVPAALKLADERPVFEMPTSTGTLRRISCVGVLEFTLQGQPMTLGAFVEDGPGHSKRCSCRSPTRRRARRPIRPAATSTSHPTSTGLYTVDFNRAYNPYCAYNATYECPFPPPSNRLKVADSSRREGARRMSRALQAIVFDFDGVIANSEPLHLHGVPAGAATRTASSSTAADYYAHYLGLRRRRRASRRWRAIAAWR